MKNQSDLARKLGVSRVRVSQVLSLLKSDVKIIEAIEKLGDPMPTRIITERMLREYQKHPELYHEYIQKRICSCLK
jgi:DNA-binding transcriptional regulator LsrR (DeoR family)